MVSFLQATCLKPSYSLRRQLLLSFGSSAFVALGLVVILACIAAHLAGELVKGRSDDLVRQQVIENLQTSSRFVADGFSGYMANVDGSVQLIVEMTRDRIVGYPSDGWERDLHVPFVDMDTNNTNKYPLKSFPVPLDWNLTLNVDADNVEEHAGSKERAAWFAFSPHPVSSASSSYYIQGSCDPDAEPDSPAYLEGCTEANNDIRTGGVLQPTRLSKGLHEKASDLNVFLKPLFESQSNALLVGIYFFNMGAGSVLQYPGIVRDRQGQVFVSKGCEWMRATNPYTNRPFASEEEIARCHPAGHMVPLSEYNPAEREWFRDCVLNSQEGGVRWFGPYPAVGGEGLQIVSASRAIFDRRTGELIGCVSLDVADITLNRQLEGARIHNESEVAIARSDTGALVAGSLDMLSGATDDNDDPCYVIDTISGNRSILKAMKNAANLRKEWTLDKVAHSYLRNVITCKNGIHTVYPLLGPPDKYHHEDDDSTTTAQQQHQQQPAEFLAVYSVSNDIFSSVREVGSSIDTEVSRLIMSSVGVGILGMIVVLTIVWCVSLMLTRPLLWIESLARRVVNHTATDEKNAGRQVLNVPENDEVTIKCSPKTEITKLVSEFRTMIKGFSGEGASIVAECDQHEISNELTWQSDFHLLHSHFAHHNNSKKSRQTSDGTATATETTEEESFDNEPNNSNFVPMRRRSFLHKKAAEAAALMVDSATTTSIVPAPPKKNVGRNVMPPAPKSKLKGEFGGFGGGGWGLGGSQTTTWTCRSSLFWWIVGLIVVPLLVASAFICGIVTDRIVDFMPSLVHIAKDASFEQEMAALKSTTSLKAKLAETMIFDPVRDVHLMTRVAGWLLFDGISRSEGFTQLETFIEECKIYPPNEMACPRWDTFVCPCKWRDIWGRLPCEGGIGESEARRMQVRSFLAQRRDADPVTGDRDRAISFPEYDYSANTTLWFESVRDLPGSHKGSNASGFRTAYDRARVSSALAVVEMPVYNYLASLGRTKFDLGTFLNFQADGLMTGFWNCDPAYEASHFVSNKNNRAAELAPELCPEGKYGFDPRCRDWYAAGKAKYLDAGESLHITAPYPFAVDHTVAAGATSPVANPRTNEYVGQMLLDFWPSGIRRSLEMLKGPLSILITPEKDNRGGDTVVGPNKTAGWKSASVVDLIFPDDPPGSPNREYFENHVLPLMKNGSSDVAQFGRTRPDGTTETFRMAYEPVFARTLLGVSPDDFSRGTTESKKLVYAVGIAYDENDMTEPFYEILDDIDRDMKKLGVIYMSVVGAISFLIIVVTCRITVHVTKPMITLLRVVQMINSGMLEDDIPPLRGGSREVNQVYSSFTKLYKILRMSNTAFFSGNLKYAYHFVSDALKLFRKVDDRKAIGIACNNLGNTIYAMHYDNIGGRRDTASSTCCGAAADDDGMCLTTEALQRYDESILIGQQEFDGAAEEELKADFAQQLADRLFNRGLFLLLAQNDPCAPGDAKERAYRDVSRARDLDRDIRDFWLERKLLLSKSACCFDRLLRRAHGLADYFDDDVLRTQIWDAKELVAEADHLLFAAWKETSAPLFHRFTPIGRLQQLEAAAIRLELYVKNDLEAARFAMRMFTEDEYILEGTFKSAGNTLLRLMREDEPAPWAPKTVASTRADLRKMVKASKQNVSLNMAKCFVLTLELCERWHDDPLLEKVQSNCLKLYDSCLERYDHFGLVAYTIRGDLTVGLGAKGDGEDSHRALINMATSSTSERVRPAFPIAVQMVVDAAASIENDSFVLLLTDGYSWDSESYTSIKWQIDRLNRERSTTIHVIIIGMDVEEDSIVHECKTFSTVSRSSFYVDATMDNVDETFDRVSAAIMGRTAATGERIQGITMEKF